MKGRLQQAQNVLGSVVLLGFGYFLWLRRDQLGLVFEESGSRVLLLAVLILATWAVGALQSFALYRAAALRVRFFEMWMLTMAVALGNYLPMRMGTLVRAHYLKEVYGFRYARFGSVFGVHIVLLVFASALMGALGVIGLAWETGRLSWQLLGAFVALGLLPALAWRVPFPHHRAGNGRWWRIARDFAEGVDALRAQPRAASVVLVAILIQQVLVGVRFMVASVAMGEPQSFMLMCVLAPLANLVSFLAITPGAVGIREALMGYATFAVGQSFERGAGVGTIERAVLLVVVAVAGSLSFLWIWYRLRALRGRKAI